MTREIQLQNNVEKVLDEYCNGMLDFPEDYPEMTIDECREYVVDQIYDMKYDGHGHTRYQHGICDDLKLLGNDYIYSVIDGYAKMNNIIVKNKIETVEITKEMLEKIHTDSDIEDLADELNVSYGELEYFILNKYAEGTPCHNCKHIVMNDLHPCSCCSRKHQTDYFELKE